VYRKIVEELWRWDGGILEDGGLGMENREWRLEIGDWGLGLTDGLE
jgi:hypothetical protein